MKRFVKTILGVTLLVCLVLSTSCSKSDSPDPVKEEAVKEEPKEEELPKEETPSAEASNIIADNIIIKGGAKVEGTPPTPNEAINMDLSSAGKTAVLDEGFIIPIQSEADITGAYIQFKAIDGGVSESYYNVDIAENQEEPEASGKHRKFTREKSKKMLSQTAKTTDAEIDIDLDAEIGPGEFCYIICVYDAAGNISAPQEVCVTVNAFGGNEALVGTWHLTRWEDNEEGFVETETVGEEYCNENDCEIQEYGTITFNADGTFEFNERYIGRMVDGAYGNDFDEYISRGKWSYPSSLESNLVLVEYYYSETDQNGTTEETYAVGEAPYVNVLNAENIELTATNLTIVERYDDDGDGNFEEVYTEYYAKQ